MLSAELTIRHAQQSQPWTVPYSPGVVEAQALVPHILGSHVALHAAKSVGKLAAVFEAADHRDGSLTFGQITDVAHMAADLVTAALRLANLYGFDLATVLVERVEEKNGVNILAEARAAR